MPIRVRCAGCDTLCRVAEQHAGKRVLCPGCRQPLTVPAVGHPIASTPPPVTGEPANDPAQPPPAAGTPWWLEAAPVKATPGPKAPAGAEKPGAAGPPGHGPAPADAEDDLPAPARPRPNRRTAATDDPESPAVVRASRPRPRRRAGALWLVAGLSAAALLLALGAAGFGAWFFWLRVPKSDLHWHTADFIPSSSGFGTDGTYLTPQARQAGLTFVVVQVQLPEDTSGGGPGPGPPRPSGKDAFGPDSFDNVFKAYRLLIPDAPDGYPFQVSWGPSGKGKHVDVTAVFVAPSRHAEAGSLRFQYGNQPPLPLTSGTRGSKASTR